jgi:o-succinylbenzoate synthase
MTGREDREDAPRLVDVEPFSLPLSSPLGTARGEIRERNGFLVRVEHHGTTGVGEATPLPGWTESLSTCRTTLESSLGAPVEDGPTDRPAAAHALDVATVDAAARAAGESVTARLGGSADRVPVNATVGDADVEATVSAAQAAVEAGSPTVKVKVGARTSDEDATRLHAVREACPDVGIRADANGAWDRPIAAEFCRRTADVDLAYVEQPLPAGDLVGHAALRADSPTPVALDESLAEHPVETVLEAAAADVLVLKPMALGGVRPARAAATAARAAGLEAVFTTTVDGAYARAAAVHVAASIPDVPACGLATADRLGADLVEPDPVPVVDGAVRVPAGPGLF